ncbi:MAG: hypothetical protein RLP44_17340 [Aggregatilineales bacterium]
MVKLLMIAMITVIAIAIAVCAIALSFGESLPIPSHRLLYMATRGRVSDSEIFMLDVDRGLSISATHERVVDGKMIVSPDGEWIIYRPNTETRSFSLINLNTGERQILPELPGQLSMLPVTWLENDQISVSFIQEGQLYNITYDLHTLDATEHHDVFLEAQMEVYEYLSPDSRHVAVMRDLAGQRDLYLEPAQGGNALNLTNDDHFESFVAWSPDSCYLAYVLVEHETILEFRIMEVSSQKIVYRSDEHLTSAEIVWASEG